jgi:hypothetical protein
MLKQMVDKMSGTSADTLLAAGYMNLLSDLYHQTGKPYEQLALADAGPYWCITCPSELTEEDIAQLQPRAVLEPLITQSTRIAVGEIAGFRYDDERAHRDAYRQQLELLPASARTPDARLNDDPALQALHDRIREPHPHLPLYAAVNQMKVAPSFNEPVLRWIRLANLPPEVFQAHIRLLFRLFNQHPNPVKDIIEEWQQIAEAHQLGTPEMTLLQVINPTTGKGANKAKADGLSIGGVSGFWLLELLKFVGYFSMALPQNIQNSDDRKTYVIRPVALERGTLDRLMGDFRKVLWSSTSAKLDILAVLRLVQVLINHREKILGFIERQQKRKRAITFTELIQGLDVTFYKSLGSAVATMNLGFIGLPEWLNVPETLGEAEQVKKLLKEHVEIIGRLDESRGGEERLIQNYRAFLSSRDPALTAFFHFTQGYATLLMSRLAKREPVVYLTTTNLEVLMTARDQQHENAVPLAPILQREGFKNIATAIRDSTINAQYQVAQLNNKRYQVRYGLGQELTRSLHSREAFIDELRAFLQPYNTETAREEEKAAKAEGGKLTPEARRKYGLRQMVSTNDVIEVLELMDTYGYKTIANLLITYGYAFDSAKLRSTEA